MPFLFLYFDNKFTSIYLCWSRLVCHLIIAIFVSYFHGKSLSIFKVLKVSIPCQYFHSKRFHFIWLLKIFSSLGNKKKCEKEKKVWLMMAINKSLKFFLPCNSSINFTLILLPFISTFFVEYFLARKLCMKLLLLCGW